MAEDHSAWPKRAVLIIGLACIKRTLAQILSPSLRPKYWSVLYYSPAITISRGSQYGLALLACSSLHRTAALAVPSCSVRPFVIGTNLLNPENSPFWKPSPLDLRLRGAVLKHTAFRRLMHGAALCYTSWGLVWRAARLP
ncbi:hypothetical protein E2C01_013336 [Portunus trituberculatus]|uniref:Uncharacterized protein n=1 Tax=Portunus trituberculatus TaxID=210409 RepID=A0A5B7DGR3_PORTR|nr:hypothetical protein [Portunus trituberculatus]